MIDLAGLFSRLLISTGDYEKLLESLITSLRSKVDVIGNSDSDSIFCDHDFVTTLQSLHSVVELYLNKNSSEKELLESHGVLSQIITDLAIPLLINPNLSQQVKGHTETARVICDVTVICLQRADNSTQHKFWQFFLDYLSSLGKNKISSEESAALLNDTKFLLQILKDVLKGIENSSDKVCDSIFFRQAWDEKYFQTFVALFTKVDDKLVTAIVSMVMLKLVKLQTEKIAERLEIIWEEILKIYHKSTTLPISGWGNCSNVSEKPYIILNGMADLYFPVSVPIEDLQCDNHFDLRKKFLLWKIIQEGLVQKEPVTRKRSLYLLKRIVDICGDGHTSLSSISEDCGRPSPIFWWSPGANTSLFKIWEDFFLLIETLNEKQIHVVRPLFPRLDRLIEACSLEQTTGHSLLHASWVVTMVRRAVLHESPHVVLWAVKALLKMKADILISHGEEKYISGEFLRALRETRLYCRKPNEPLGTQPEIGLLLIESFQSLWKHLETSKRAEFFTDMLRTIRGVNWGSLTLLYLSQALSKLPPGPIWDTEAVQAIREVMNTSLGTMEPFIRGTVQGFLMESLLRHVDLDKVTPAEVAVVLGECSKQESLQRGTTLWQKMTISFRDIYKDENSPEHWRKEAIMLWLETSVNQYLKSQIRPAQNYTLQLIRMLLLFEDCGAVSHPQVSLIDSCLSSVRGTLCSVISHAYLSCETGDRALEILVNLLEEAMSDWCKEDDLIKKLASTLGDSFEGIVHQINKGKECIKSTNDDDRLHLYLNVLDCLSRSPWVDCVSKHAVLESVEGLVKWSVTVLEKLTNNNQVTEEKQVCLVMAMSILSKLSAIFETILPTMPQETWQQYPSVTEVFSFLKKFKPQTGLRKPPNNDSISIVSHSGQKDWGRFVSLYLTSQWLCFKFLVGTVEEMPLSQEIVDGCVEAVALGSADPIVPVISCLEILLPKCLKLDQEEVVVLALKIVWTRLKEIEKSAIFWQELQSFVSMAFQMDLMCAGEKTGIPDALKKYAMELIKLGDERNGIVNVLMSQFCAISTQDKPVSAITHFSDIVAEVCVFGNVPPRIERTLLETYAYIDSLGNECSVNQLMPTFASPDAQVRLTVINFLTSLQPDCESHSGFVSRLIGSLIKKHENFNKSQSQWNFTNSIQHRRSHRITQLLLILVPFIQSQEQVENVWRYVWSVLTIETQPSVRNYLEWLVLRLLVRFNHTLLKQLWLLFETTSLTEKRHMSLCSLLFVLSHLGPHLPRHLQESFYNKALVVCFPWCTVHHFNTRIHGQVCMKKIWKQCHDLDLQTLTEAYPMIEICLNFHKEESNSTKNAEKLETHYMFSVFDIMKDFSTETICLTLPMLSKLSDEEWITPDVFVRSDTTWRQEDTHYLPLYNSNDKLKNCQPGPWRLKGEDKYGCQVTEESTEDGDVQKKILPWRFLKPDQEADNFLEPRAMRKREDGLILVTSLIDKIPNLGGLCRTSEIFGVCEFVVANLETVHDKAFTSLSVTAHKWLPITEVKPFRIGDYLEAKRAEGYTIVGVEQTANSVSLSEYQFPEKTLLLLGNEKEGIPVNLIQLLDTCVEIPQQGVIRSLNVHVSGALFVWEYRRQQLIKM